jgi:hypothetical protein
MKYLEESIYKTQKRYTVYNSIISLPAKLIDWKKLESKNSTHVPVSTSVYELYKLLLSSPNEVVNIEQHRSVDGLKSELRVIFWDEDSYYRFAKNNSEKYKEVTENITTGFIAEKVNFSRFTSTDNHISEFPEYFYPDATPLINWTLIGYLKQWVLDNIIGFGRYYADIGNGNINKIDISGSRFIKERTSNIIRRPPDKNSRNTFPELLSYHFEQVVESTSIKKQPYVYNKFISLSRDVETFAEKYISSCDNAVVLVGHDSLGTGINTHTHRITDGKKFTFTIAIQLTFSDEPVTYKFFQPLDDNDKDISLYYADVDLLESKIEGQVPTTLRSLSRSSVLVFNAAYTPHSVDYSNDLYLFFVYDNVEFNPGMFEHIQEQSQHKLFADRDQSNHLFFWEM